jgi:hypothetical protein
MIMFYCYRLLLFWLMLQVQIRIITSVSIFREANKECIDLVWTHIYNAIHNVYSKVLRFCNSGIYNYMLGDGEQILCCRSMIIQSETVLSILLLSRIFSLILAPCAIS